MTLLEYQAVRGWVGSPTVTERSGTSVISRYRESTTARVSHRLDEDTQHTKHWGGYGRRKERKMTPIKESHTRKEGRKEGGSTEM